MTVVRGALVLAVLGQHVGGEGDEGARFAAQSQDALADLPLVGRVQKGEEETDGHRLDPVGQQLPRRRRRRPRGRGGRGPVPCLSTRSGSSKRQRGGHQGRGPGRVQGIEVGPGLAADLQHVAKALGGDRGPCVRPRRSSRALVATVAPWTTVASGPASRSAMPCRIATDWSRAEVSSLWMRTWPASSSRTKVGEGAADVDAEDHSSTATGSVQLGLGCRRGQARHLAVGQGPGRRGEGLDDGADQRTDDDGQQSTAADGRHEPGARVGAGQRWR